MTRPERVLVVGERSLAAELVRMLFALECGVAGVHADGESALAAIERSAPDLVLVDARLGGDLDAVALATSLAKRRVPFVLVAADLEDSTTSRVRELGPLGYLTPPFDARVAELSLESALFRAQRERRRTEARLAAALEESPDAIVSVDGHQRIVVFNHAAERLFGWRAADVVGLSLDVLLPPEARERHREHIMQFAEEAADTRMMGERAPLLALRRDGSEVPIAASLSRHGSGAEVQFTAVLHDVSREEEMRARLQQAQKMEAVGRLAATVVHDVNNLLAIVQNAVDLARAECTSKHLQTIADAVADGAALTRRLLLFARDEPVRAEIVEVDDLIERVRPLARSLATGANWLIVERHAGGAVVRIDPRRFEQVILNCVANARDALDSGQIRIRSTSTEERVCVEIRDSGRGISPDVLPRVFDPFFTTKPPGHGTGLGLSLARDVIEQAGGTIEVESVVGQGTSVRILLPRAHGAVEPAVRAAEHTIVRPSARVLIVDDEEDLRIVLARGLKDDGCDVRTASGAGAALVALEDGPMFDVLVTDVVMPIMSGAELARRMRRYLPRLGVVYMTGCADEQGTASLPCGPRDLLLAKPFAVEDLRKKIAALVGGEEGEE